MTKPNDQFTKCFCDESGLSPTTPCVGCPRWSPLRTGAGSPLEKLSEDVAEPTEPSLRVPTPLRSVSLTPDEDVIQCLEDALKDARSGELRGVLVFGSKIAGDTCSGEAGDTSLPAILMAFEHWKYRSLRSIYKDE